MAKLPGSDWPQRMKESTNGRDRAADRAWFGYGPIQSNHVCLLCGRRGKTRNWGGMMAGLPRSDRRLLQLDAERFAIERRMP
jgi:hypothetical protein